MKALKIPLFLAISIIIFSSYSSDDSIKLYEDAITKHFINLDVKVINILKCTDIELPTEIGKYTVVEIRNIKKYLEDSSSLYAIKLVPFKLSKGDIKIEIIDYLFKFENGEVIMINTGGEVFTYRYNKRLMQYQLLKKEKKVI